MICGLTFQTLGFNYHSITPMSYAFNLRARLRIPRRVFSIEKIKKAPLQTDQFLTDLSAEELTVHSDIIDIIK